MAEFFGSSVLWAEVVAVVVVVVVWALKSVSPGSGASSGTSVVGEAYTTMAIIANKPNTTKNFRFILIFF